MPTKLFARPSGTATSVTGSGATRFLSAPHLPSAWPSPSACSQFQTLKTIMYRQLGHYLLGRLARPLTTLSEGLEKVVLLLDNVLSTRYMLNREGAPPCAWMHKRRDGSHLGPY